MKSLKPTIKIDYSDFTERMKAKGDPNSPCRLCGLERLPTGEDPCLGHLSGVANACCGHGKEQGVHRVRQWGVNPL